MSNTVVYKLRNQIIKKKKVIPPLKPFFEYYWSVSWAFPNGESMKQQVLREPKADICYSFDTT